MFWGEQPAIETTTSMVMLVLNYVVYTWSRIPIEIIDRGAARGWLKIKTARSNFLTGKSKAPSLKKRKVSKETEIYSSKLNNELNGNVGI